MKGIQEQTVNDLFALMPPALKVQVSFFEIYGGKCYDLLNSKATLAILEDKNNNIQV
jgi:kinesin family protein 2/24